MNDTTLSLWLSVAFLTLFFLAVLTTLLWWQDRTEKNNRRYLEIVQQNQKATLEVLNKTITLLSVKDPLAYQAVTSMEVPLTSDVYYAQDDASEAYRREELAGNDDNNSQWYESAFDGGVEFNPITSGNGGEH
jgi:cbb3-type cytochrome oxidase subunit 3